MSRAEDWDGVLRVSSCMSENAEFICQAIARYIAERLSIPTEFINDIPWQQREFLLEVGHIQIGWICALPYVLKVADPLSRLELLAAPVMCGERYHDRPICFSDVVVHRESGFQTFADLRGAAWVYNEPGSHSGFNLVGYHLATLGEKSSYFRRIVESGSHQTSLRMILNREADFSAIDSTVLEIECRRDPGLASAIRLIDTLGPSPSPPFVIQKDLPQALKRKIQDLLLQMHTDPQAAQILDGGVIARFASVRDSDYDLIRTMAQLRDAAQLQRNWPPL